MSNIIPFARGGMPAVFQTRNLPDMNAAARAGLSPSFAVIGYKGRNWRIKHAGEDELLREPNGAPVATLDVVIVGISSAISKIFYEKKYTEGDDAAPDCWSTDGVRPDPKVTKKQHDTCDGCVKDAWGSRVTDAGKKAKACQDSRRLVVVPADDPENEGYGGPMLLRLPPMSLGNLAAYTKELEKYGAQPYAVRTVLGFNYDVAYPEITFSTTGWLDDETAVQIATMIDEDTRIATILAESSAAPSEEYAAPEPTPTPVASALAKGKPTAPAPAPTPAPTPPQAPAAEAEVEDAEAAELARMEAELAAKRAAAAAKKAEAKASAPAAPATPAAPSTPPAGTQGAAKKSPFGPKKAQAQAAPIESEQKVNGTGVTVKPAPDDMEAAINSLL